MKILYAIISMVMLSSVALSQSEVKIISADDGTDYTGDTVIFSGDGLAEGGIFYVINTGSVTKSYKYGALPISRSNPTFKFQFCELEGGGNPGLCYTNQNDIGEFWETPAFMENIAPGDSMKVEIKMTTSNTSGTGKARYYVLNDHGTKIDSITTFFTSTVSLDENTLPEFKIYPNPTTKEITIQGDGLKNGGTVVFRDALGKEVKRTNLSEMHTMINVSALNKGIYFVSIIDNNGVKSEAKRLIVK